MKWSLFLGSSLW